VVGLLLIGIGTSEKCTRAAGAKKQQAQKQAKQGVGMSQTHPSLTIAPGRALHGYIGQ
jgi:hypothetical protein